MPTRRGLLVVLAGVVSWVGGRVLGAPPLEQLGFGLIVLVVGAVVVLRIGSHDIRATRVLTPQKVSAGQEVQVGMRIDNLGDGPTPLVLMEDGVAAELGGTPRFVLEGLRPGDRRQVRYVLRPRRRGRWEVGPLRLVFRDPFGVARLRATTGGTTSFLVFPRVEHLALPSFPTARRTPARSARRELTGARGEDFYTLREYVDGDDLRRIHWRATAKRGRYMIRQEETPWQTRATVLLDDRSSGYSRATWERALEATASVADLFLRSGYTVALSAALSGGGRRGKGTQHLQRCLERLVTLEPARPTAGTTASDPLLARLGAISATASGSEILVAVLGRVEQPAAEGLIRAASRCRAAVAIVVEDLSEMRAEDRAERDGTAVALQAAGVRVLRLHPRAALAPAWEGLWTRADSSERRGGEAWEPKRARA